MTKNQRNLIQTIKYDILHILPTVIFLRTRCWGSYYMRGSRGSQDLTNMHQGRNVEKRKRLQNARKRRSLLVSVPVSNIVKKKRKQTDF